IVRDRQTTPTTTIGVIGTDLVSVDISTDGHLRVERTDPLATTPRWTFTSPTTWRADAGSVPTIEVEAGRVFVGGGTSGWVVLSSDGTLVRAGDPAGRVAGFTGRSLFTESTSSAADAPRTDVLDLSTGRSVTVAGDIAGPSPDDRSLPDVVLTWTRDSLVASDVTTGATRWSTPLRVNGQGPAFLRGGGQVMVVDGHVVVDDARSVRVLDGRSGRVVWERRHATPVDRGAATDGTVVVTVTTESNSTATMTAFGVADGVQRWSIAVPPLAQQLTTLGRDLVVVTPGSITVWR
ncbi:MAG TPA: PQQ-binding-like beta-propeller repeat protein, partial [Cellulomonadaceae bacterium]|nr:PQQ-binding-like beta-propeller repeat protein [Cellulomonadaceae bacterium]